MSTLNYITTQQLPLNQDFTLLKETGLAYIQAHSGLEWTNFNASDPGVTILDQLCFALTELGYCNDFNVADILTDHNGQLQIKDQFYLPEKILTTSPVTIADYRKYIIDGVDGVTNVFIPKITGTSVGAHIYNIYLQINEAVTDNLAIEAICDTAFFYLNKRRNLGEVFLVSSLTRMPYLISGKIEITNQAMLQTIIVQLNNSIRNFIFPEVVASGYDQLVQNSEETNEIFNGPILQNGWIPTDALGKKQDELTTLDLTAMIEAIPGVSSISGLTINGKPGASVDELEVLVIDLEGSLKKGLEFWCKGIKVGGSANLKLNTTLNRSQGMAVNIEFGAALAMQTGMPNGKYRDINNYYSIQNTFPEIFAVGADAINSNASNFQIAQSRQLKGYLTLFDQVLANQFSQLANIDKLFSFKNATTGTPSDQEEFYAVKDKYERRHPEYPVPYQAFSPTYFYQALYDVPHIKPLLKNNDTFKFSYELETTKELEQNSWKAYKLDPYNPYIWGLMDLMEDEQTSLLRRNDILDHLLARHGESPLLINAIIDGSVYAGDSLQDQVIFKSLYLQNLGLLSYFRQKACCFTTANLIKDGLIEGGLPEVPADFERRILGGNIHDAIFNSPKVDHIERLTVTDVDNYAAIELKIALLFGLKALYKNFIANNFEDKQKAEAIKLAYWLITNRKGMIMLETGLPLQYVEFTIIITNSTDHDSGTVWQTVSGLKFIDAVNIYNTLTIDTKGTIEVQTDKPLLIVNEVQYPMEEVKTAGNGYQYLKPVTGLDFRFTIMISSGVEIDAFADNPVFSNSALFIFPEFINNDNYTDLPNRLGLFLSNELPVQIPGYLYFMDTTVKAALIPVFCAWHNCLVFPDPEPKSTDIGIDPSKTDWAKFYSSASINDCAGQLISFFIQYKLKPL